MARSLRRVSLCRFFPPSAKVGGTKVSCTGCVSSFYFSFSCVYIYLGCHRRWSPLLLGNGCVHDTRIHLSMASLSASISGSMYFRSMRNVPARNRTAHTSLGRRSTTRPGSPTSTRSPRRNEDIASADFKNGGARVTTTAVPWRSGGDEHDTKRGCMQRMLRRRRARVRRNERCSMHVQHERIFAPGGIHGGRDVHRLRGSTSRATRARVRANEHVKKRWVPLPCTWRSCVSRDGWMARVQSGFAMHRTVATSAITTLCDTKKSNSRMQVHSNHLLEMQADRDTDGRRSGTSIPPTSARNTNSWLE